jgi:hypothetical protein
MLDWDRDSCPLSSTRLCRSPDVASSHSPSPAATPSGGAHSFCRRNARSATMRRSSNKYSRPTIDAFHKCRAKLARHPRLKSLLSPAGRRGSVRLSLVVSPPRAHWWRSSTAIEARRRPRRDSFRANDRATLKRRVVIDRRAVPAGFALLPERGLQSRR